MMKNLRTIAAAAAPVVAATALIACDNPSARAPVAPSAPPAVSQPAMAVFRDPLSGLSTSDVGDAHDRVVRFTTARELIWIDGTHLSGHEAGGPGYQTVQSDRAPLLGGRPLPEVRWRES